VSEGYSTGNQMITILQANTASVNGGYKYIKGVRVTDTGKVQIKLNAGANVSVTAEIIGSGNSSLAFSSLALASTLVREQGTPTIKDVVDPLVNGVLRVPGKLEVSGNSNTCHLVYFDIGGASCPDGYYTWDAVAAGPSGYMMCCKVDNPI